MQSEELHVTHSTDVKHVMKTLIGLLMLLFTVCHHNQHSVCPSLHFQTGRAVLTALARLSVIVDLNLVLFNMVPRLPDIVSQPEQTVSPYAD